MRCPKCGNRPLPFGRFLSTLNPFRIQCAHCQTPLRAGPLAYIWTVLHVPIGAGIVRWHFWVGRIESPRAVLDFFLGAAAILFCTAYVVPYLAFKRMYRVDDASR